MAPTIRRKKCSFIRCENNSRDQPDIKYFHFPYGNSKQWIRASGNELLGSIEESNLCKHYFVCSRHFRKTDYRRILSPFKTKVLLKNGVVPLPYDHMNLSVGGDDQPEMESAGHEDCVKYNEEDSKSSNVQVTKKKKCVYVNCSNHSKNHPEMKFYRFSSCNYKEWISASGNTKLNEVKKKNLCTNYFVCSNHFKKTDFQSMLSPFTKQFLLKRRVVPLPYNHVSLDVEGDDQPEMESTWHEDLGKCNEEDSKSSKIPVKKKKKCVYINCGNNSQNQPEMKFFRFPTSNYKDWIVASGNIKLNELKMKNLYANYFVCSNHFKKTDFRSMLSPFTMRFPLKRRVVPLPYNHVSLDMEGDDQLEMEESTGHEDLGKCSKENSKSSKIPVKKKKKCSFINCGSNSKNNPEMKFFCFPRSNYKEWIAASGCEKLNKVKEKNLCSYYFVCSNHFRLTDRQKIVSPFKTEVSLKRGVVPVPFNYGNLRIEGQSDVQSSPEKAKTRQPASKKSKTSQSSTYGTPSICLPDSSATSQTADESTSQTSQSIINISYQNFSLQYVGDSSTNNSAGAFPRDVMREDNEETHSNLRPDQTQGTAISLTQEPNNNENSEHSFPFLAPKKPTLTPLLSEVDYEKSCSKVATVPDNEVDEFVGGDEIFFESFVDDEETQMCIDDNIYDKMDDRAIERRTISCSKQGSEAEASSKEKVQMHHGSEFERDDLKVGSDVSMNVCNENFSSVPNPSLCNKEEKSSSLDSKVIEDKSLNFKDGTVGGSIVSSAGSGGAAEERGSEKLDIIVTAGVKAGLTTNSVLSAASTTGKGCTSLAENSTGSSLLSASPTATEVQLYISLPTGQTIPVKVPVAALMSASSMPSPSPLCLPPPVQQVVELPQQTSSTQSVSDVSPASDPLTGHQPGPSSAAGGSDAPEGPTNDCSSKPQKGKKRMKCVSESPSEDDEETKNINDFRKKQLATEMHRQKQRERELKNAPQIAELVSVNSKLASEVASLKAEMTTLKDLLLQHMSRPTVKGTNSFMVAATNPFVGANPFVVAAEGPKVAGANPVVVAAEGPKVAGANPVVVAAEGPKVAAANPVVVAAEGPKVAGANPVVVAAEGPKVAAVPAVRPGQSSDAVRQLMPHSHVIWPFTFKPAPAAYRVVKLIPISKI